MFGLSSGSTSYVIRNSGFLLFLSGFESELVGLFASGGGLL